MINTIKKLIMENKRLVLNFSYGKGHSGNLGNDLAEENAKEAAHNGEEVFVPITKAFICGQLHLKLSNEWKEFWNKEGKTSYTYTCIQNINLIPHHFPSNFYIYQAITGHGRFPSYFSRFGISQSSICRCNKEIDSYDPHLKECPLVTNGMNLLKN